MYKSIHYGCADVHQIKNCARISTRTRTQPDPEPSPGAVSTDAGGVSCSSDTDIMYLPYAFFMAELDYAYLADHAQIEGGKISVLGASYTHASVSRLPAIWMTSVAGRVRVRENEAPVSIRIEVTPPGKITLLNTEGTLQLARNTRLYDGKAGLLFAATLQIPIAVAGLCTLDIYLNGEHARRLAFEIEHTEDL